MELQTDSSEYTIFHAEVVSWEARIATVAPSVVLQAERRRMTSAPAL